MKYQQVSVDYWAMGKSMLTYALLAGMGWLLLRLFNAVFMLPRRLRSQQENIEHTLAELQKRFPDLNITEEDLKNAEKELDEFMKEDQDKKENKAVEDSGDDKDKKEGETSKTQEKQKPEDKKTI